jgi:hypothetical protein
MAIVLCPEARKDSTASIPLSICLAFWAQTRTQLPQRMQRSSKTWACPSLTMIALAGQFLTQA